MEGEIDSTDELGDISEIWYANSLDELEIAPPRQLVVKYNGSLGVAPGSRLDLQTVAVRPTVKLPVGINEESYYTLIMIDMDSPKQFHSVFSPVKKWMVVNIKPNESRGLTLAEYASPTPFPFTGDHRYVFLLYRQPKIFKTSVSGPQRQCFYVRRWARKRNLTLEAGTFFVAKKGLIEDEEDL